MDALEQITIAGIQVSGIMHIGANNGQERFAYRDAGISPVVFVEPIDAIFETLKEHLIGMEGFFPVKALCSSHLGELVKFNISSNNGESSSMLPLGSHADIFPNIRYTSSQDIVATTVDELMRNTWGGHRPNVLVIDTQGSELKVLRGSLQSLIDSFDAVYVEVAEEPLYEGGCTFDEVRTLLTSLGFGLRGLAIHGLGHGDAFFCKPLGRRSGDKSVIEALALLTPYDVDQRKERVGPKSDGAYVLLPELINGHTILSYGINGEYSFDVEMASRGCEMLMFDHTIAGIHNPTNDPNLRFIKEGVAGSASGLLNTIQSHICRFADGKKDMVLKMDVEGYEYEALESLPDTMIASFQQILIEIHNLHSLGDDGFRRLFVRVMSKINRHFTLYHVHANNFDGGDTYNFISGVPVSNLLELSYVRSDLVQRRPSQTLYPTEIDFPNVHPHDKKLWFYPFLPTSAASASFSTADRRMDAVARKRSE